MFVAKREILFEQAMSAMTGSGAGINLEEHETAVTVLADRTPGTGHHFVTFSEGQEGQKQ